MMKTAQRILNNLHRPRPDLLACPSDSVSSAFWKRSITQVGRGFCVCKGMQIQVSRFIAIADGIVISANSVVASDLPTRVVAAGNPAKVLKILIRNL